MYSTISDIKFTIIVCGQEQVRQGEHEVIEVISLDDSDIDTDDPSSPEGFKCLASSEDVDN